MLHPLSVAPLPAPLQCTPQSENLARLGWYTANVPRCGVFLEAAWALFCSRCLRHPLLNKVSSKVKLWVSPAHVRLPPPSLPEPCITRSSVLHFDSLAQSLKLNSPMVGLSQRLCSCDQEGSAIVTWSAITLSLTFGEAPSRASCWRRFCRAVLQSRSVMTRHRHLIIVPLSPGRRCLREAMAGGTGPTTGESCALDRQASSVVK